MVMIGYILLILEQVKGVNAYSVVKSSGLVVIGKNGDSFHKYFTFKH